jgi:DNA-binding response OmpR family regulator
MAMAYRRMKILVIDDDEYSRDALAYLLNSEGHEAVAASDAETGYRLACETPPDSIILDLSLPDTHGNELIARVRANESLKNVPILVVTGLPNDEAQSAVDSGANAYLIKPIDFDDLVKVIPNLESNLESARGRSLENSV